VLTHDVEGKKGLARCWQLAKLEEMLGFRSSFNFVAEDYKISQDLFNYLRGGGFEIGLHGIRHKGNLFRSRKTFRRETDKIKNYLKEWGAVGFRCPSMYHNLHWIGELAVDYDSSTFDIDPFEPQADGVGTIYPFMVGKKESQKSYVELPYTLPQDFLIYIMMGETTSSVWRKKLNWIADQGGMALLVTHPDYMSFDAGRDSAADEYPVAFYSEFLEHVKACYEGQYWHALPREVAGFLRESENVRQGFAM
jgi:peptidoglycan/xylan/chitin deacetylase (PgdA/CDA1 family)